MNQNELEQNIVKALENNPYCSFSTVENGKPKSRYMAIFNDGLNIHLATNRQTHKVEELENNPNVSLLLGYEAGGTKEVVEIEGTCEVTKDESLREQVWNDELKAWFDGPNDPNYVILDITPARIEYTGKDHEHHVWEQ